MICFKHRDCSKHIERACSVEAFDKIKQVVIYCRFNITRIRKTVCENKIIFVVYYYLYDFNGRHHRVWVEVR